MSKITDKDKKEDLNSNEQIIESKVNSDNNFSKENFTSDEESATQNESLTKVTSSKKSVGFWLGLLGVLVVVLQVICSYLKINFDAKIIIELASFVLAILVVLGVLKSNTKSKNLTIVKEDIEKELSEKIESFKSQKKMQGENDSAQNGDNNKKTTKQ